MRRAVRAWFDLLLLATLLLATPATLALGCAPELGVCDEPLARRVAYDDLPRGDGTPSSGLPAYEGQALLIQSCGYGSFCHGADIPVQNRHGVPLGLTFDVQLAAPDGFVDESRVARLRRGRFRVVQEAQAILEAIDIGSMPPYGDDVTEVFRQAPVYVDRDSGERLASVETPAGREILRNWLACGAPVVERAAPRDDGVSAVVEEPLIRPPIEPNWPSIYDNLVRARGCAVALCHGGADERAGFETTADSASTLSALINQPASGSECDGEGMLIVPGNPDASLFLTKLRGTSTCGDPMPSGGLPLRQVELDAVARWIACEAPAGAEGCPPDP